VGCDETKGRSWISSMKKSLRSRLISSFGPESEVFRTLAAVRQQGGQNDRVIDLTVGSPDGPPEREVIETLMEVIKQPDIHGYGSIDGEQELRKQIVTWYRECYRVELDPDREVLPLIGSKRFMIDLAVDLVNPGSHVLLPEIGYPTYKIAAMISGGIPHWYGLDEKNGYRPDFADIDSEVLRNSDLIYLNYPQNPTGAVVEDDTFKRIIELARKYDFTICHDNAYGPIVYDGRNSPSFLQQSGAKETGIEVLSFSKIFNMAGWRVACVAGKQAVIDIVRQSLVDYTSGIFTPIQFAAAKALEICFKNDVIPRQVKKYEQRRDLVLDCLDEIGWDFFKPGGGFYVWSRPPLPGCDSIQFAKRLFGLTGVLVTPGVAYGRKGEKYLRIGLVQNEEVLQEAFQRIKAAGSRLYSPDQEEPR
jgi:LL-diaminopimelate aminotransferase